MGQENGQIVMVTGGSGNLGRAVAAAFAEHGATLALVDLQENRLKDVVANLPGGPEKHLGVSGDLSTPAGVQAVIEAIIARFGRIDALVHTVGGYAAGKPVHDESLDVLDKMISLNVRPLYLVGGAVAREMLAQGGGSIVFILAKAGQKGGKNQAAYSASKAAATRVMESMAAELREQGIRVNGVSPSTIDTPLNREQMPDADPAKWVTPQQIAHACVYLCSGDTGIYGANIEVFGTGG